MPNGILKVVKASRGTSFVVKISYFNDKKKQIEIDVPHGSIANDSHNNLSCEFDVKKGIVTSIICNNIVLLGRGMINPFAEITTSVNPAINTIAETLPTSTVTKKIIIKKPEYKLADIYNVSESYLPDDTRKKLSLANIGEIENFALKLQKAAFCDRNDKNKFKFFSNPRNGEKQMIKPNFSKVSFADIIARQDNHVKALFAKNAKKIEAKPDWRWLTGNGVESVYETNITLHHIYGIPFLPSSSLKGILRSFMITELWDVENDSEARAFNESKLMCDLFGCPKDIDGKDSYYHDKYKKTTPKPVPITADNCPEKQGALCFFELYPQSEPQIEVDVMTPHYTKYYSENQAPSDTQSPVPIPFLCIGNNAYFQTYLAISEKMATKKLSDYDTKSNKIDDICRALSNKGISAESTLLEVATALLYKALTEHGIGAKTAVGYGYFSQAE
jgi:CRISPR-associated protein Cmr6